MRETFCSISAQRISPWRENGECPSQNEQESAQLGLIVNKAALRIVQKHTALSHKIYVQTSFIGKAENALS